MPPGRWTTLHWAISVNNRTQILRGRQAVRDPLRPQLHRVLEAQVARIQAGIVGGLRHEHADHVAGQQMAHFWVEIRASLRPHLFGQGPGYQPQNP